MDMKNVLLLLLLVLHCNACKPAKTTAMPVAVKSALVPPPQGLQFYAYAGDPTKTALTKMAFQVGWADHRQPNDFLGMDQFVPNTKFRIVAFQFKAHPDPKTGEQSDVSELTFTNTDTHESFVLPLRQAVDSPPVF
jgi:hypothetical protein